MNAPKLTFRPLFPLSTTRCQETRQGVHSEPYDPIAGPKPSANSTDFRMQTRPPSPSFGAPVVSPGARIVEPVAGFGARVERLTQQGPQHQDSATGGLGLTMAPTTGCKRKMSEADGAAQDGAWKKKHS